MYPLVQPAIEDIAEQICRTQSLEDISLPEDTPYIEELARTEGILLDPVYTGKAFAAMMQMLRQGEFDGEDDLLFLHTGGAAALFAMDLPR